MALELYVLDLMLWFASTRMTERFGVKPRHACLEARAVDSAEIASLMSIMIRFVSILSFSVDISVDMSIAMDQCIKASRTTCWAISSDFTQTDNPFCQFGHACTGSQQGLLCLSKKRSTRYCPSHHTLSPALSCCQNLRLQLYLALEVGIIQARGLALDDLPARVQVVDYDANG